MNYLISELKEKFMQQLDLQSLLAAVAIPAGCVGIR